MATTYTDRELQRAKDVLEACDLVSSSTKGCYSSRIALWMHYCTICCNGDEQVTGQRLADYVEWMVSSGSAERIRQGTTHIQQVLRNQLQGVLCYWRIQNANLPNAEDPRGDPTFKMKWQQIVMRYPSSRHSRRAEPIYGVQRLSATAEQPVKGEYPPIMPASGGAPYPGHMGAPNSHSGPGGYSALRQAPSIGASSPGMPTSTIQHAGRNPNYRPHPSQMNQPRQSSPSHGTHPYAQQPGMSQRPWYQNQYDERTQNSSHQSPQNAHAPASYPGSSSNRPLIPSPSTATHPQAPASYNQQSQTVPERVPPASGSYYPGKSSYLTAPQHPGALPHQRPPIPHTDPRTSPHSLPPQLSPSQQHRMHENPAGHPIMSKGVSPSGPAAAAHPASSRQHDPSVSRMSVDSEEGPISGMSSRVPDNADISRPASDGATAVPSSPKLSGTQYVLEGIVPEDIPEWSSDDAKESADAPEGHLLNQNELIALSIRQLGVRPELQMQARAHILLGLSSWLSASSRTELTLGDIWTEEPSDIPLPDVELQVKRGSDAIAETEKEPEKQAESDKASPKSEEASSESAETSQNTPSEKEESSPDIEMAEEPAHEKTPEQQEVEHDTAEPENTSTEPEKQTKQQPETNDEADEKDLPAKALLEIKNQEPSKQQEPQPQPQAQPQRVLSVALRTFGGRTTSNSPIDDKALVLRHSNPLLCPWGALSFMLFSRWHVANEPAPDFSTSAWQSLKLFPGLSDKDNAPTESDFEQLFEEALLGVTKDKLDGTKVMSDSGYFFADTFGLVRPTATGIKGLDGIDAISTNTLLPEVLSALVRANAGYPADPLKECTAPKRFGVMPSQSLQREVFPWIKPLLIGAFEQSNNNDDVRSATRLLRVLRELRIVLLQDVAFLMEMPYLNKVIEDNVFFKHELFSSPDFNIMRQEMRAAVGETEIRNMEAMCTAAVSWVKNRRSEVPDGSTERMIPTAPRLLNPETYSISANGSAAVGPDQQPRPGMETTPQPPGTRRFSGAPSLPTSHAIDEERKRQREPVAPGEDDSAYFGENSGDAYDADRLPKRSRRVYEMALGGSPYRIYGDAAGASGQPEQPGAKPIAGNGSDDMADALNSLRAENEDLKTHVRKLEWVISQHKTEVQVWMSKMEKTVQSVSTAASRQPSPHMRNDHVQALRSTVPPSASPAMAARQPALGSHMQPSYHENMGSQQQLSQPSTPRNRYIDGQYQPPAGRAPGLHAQASMHGIRESAGHYERPIKIASDSQYQQAPIQPAANGMTVQQQSGKHQEYRGPPMRVPPSPRGQAYGQRPPSSEYSEYRPIHQQDGAAYAEQGWYTNPRDEPMYPTRH